MLSIYGLSTHTAIHSLLGHGIINGLVRFVSPTKLMNSYFTQPCSEENKQEQIESGPGKRLLQDGGEKDNVLSLQSQLYPRGLKEQGLDMMHVLQ